MASASMTDVWRFFAGDSLTAVPAKLTADQKAEYRIADFRTHWGELTDEDKDWFKAEVSNLMPLG